MDRNAHIARLVPSYLFQEVQQHKKRMIEERPGIRLLDLGVGDTTQPIPASAAKAMARVALAMADPEQYRGYGPEQGILPMRQAIAEKCYSSAVDPDEVFISDGAKCDVARLQVLFGSARRIAVQDPAYPVYSDGSIALGIERKNIHLLPCTAENGFFPSSFPEVDLIYFCSPNNPTGHAATRQQLIKLVEHARKTGAVILFDAAYSCFISDPTLPRSIFDIPHAEEVAIEINSFSKMAGFTGLRLGWTVVPRALRYQGGEAIHSDWKRIMGTLFNGASRIVQEGALAMLSDENRNELQQLIRYYQTNARLLKEALQNKRMEVYGADHAPYLWVRFAELSSWDAFHLLLQEAHCVTVPGAGFGPSGEGFIRLSALGHRETILEAVHRFSLLPLGVGQPSLSHP